MMASARATSCNAALVRAPTRVQWDALAAARMGPRECCFVRESGVEWTITGACGSCVDGQHLRHGRRSMRQDQAAELQLS